MANSFIQLMEEEYEPRFMLPNKNGLSDFELAIGEDIPVGQVLGWIYAAGEAYNGPPTANQPAAAKAAPPAAFPAAASANSNAARSGNGARATPDRKSTRLNSSHGKLSRMPSSA